MLTNFQISHKTKRPACCDWDCCGSKWGRIGRNSHQRKAHRNHRGNRIIKVRRYAKRVEKRLITLEITSEVSLMLEMEYENNKWLED